MDNNPILKKQLSIQYAGNIDNYEYFKKTIGASPLLYQHDLHFFNDDITIRHNRNIKQLKYLKEVLKSGKIQPKMLKHNVINTFYPSFVLHHHYQIFVPLIQKFANTNKAVQSLYAASARFQVTGALLQAKQRWDFKQSSNQLPILSEKGFIQMNKQTYFYSGITSPYITHAAFILIHNKSPHLAIVEVRNKDGEFNNQVTKKDFGGTISQDYMPIGYNFAEVKPLIILPLTPNVLKKQVQPLLLSQRLLDFQHSLKDLHKSLWITIKYASMRKQFRTLDNSKQQRSIITYQAVASRIIDAFSFFLMSSDLNCKITDEDYYFIAFAELLPAAHHCILEQLVTLREVCGGFGFMQFSGHPGCIQRVAYRSGYDSNKELEFSTKFLLIAQYPASTDEAQKYYAQPITVERPSYSHYFGIFVSICANMRKNRRGLTIYQYKRQFFKQSALMAMHMKEDLSKHHFKNMHCLLIQYAIAGYVIKNLAFINWELVQVDRNTFYNGILQYKAELLQRITGNLIELGETLELNYLRNTIVGRDNSEQFYKELLLASRNNLRNSKQYVDYVRQPIVDMLIENRARL